MVLKYIPNIITFIRLLAIPPAIYFLWLSDFNTALIIFAFAGVSDGVDGFLARRYGWETHWGAVMDPIADKTLLVLVGAMLAFKGLLPVWLFVLMMGRDVILLSGSALYRLKFGPFQVQPSLWGKFSTFVQITLLIVLMAHVAYGVLSVWQVDFLIYLCAFATLVSGIQYVWVWAHKARNEGKRT